MIQISRAQLLALHRESELLNNNNVQFSSSLHTRNETDEILSCRATRRLQEA